MINWQGIGDATLEELTVRRGPDTIEFQSEIRGMLEGMPVSSTYRLTLFEDWTWKTFTLHEHGRLVYDLLRNRKPLYEPAYLDFHLTPATNTLPIRKEALAIGEKSLIDVLYLDYPQKIQRIEQQEYERTGEYTYRFRQTATGFEADLTVDENGFVVDYPGLFRRV